MDTSKWIIHRIGLIDFWYYDDEEFEFSDGRMLLRGSNGSGKSVTMQSFIPLLLDGNKASERLDPFGSKARKLDNYLIEEDDDRNERTGYLYMEFKRKESDQYLTLGIGLRARRNKKLESWHFVITDGRRIGKDFFLYKQMDEKITLSRQELIIRLAEGGQVVDSPKEYMRLVNEKLFGYENVEEYKELVDLLIQLRTPKLSKDFKPTILNEILSNSLPPLSDEDLRPMSEAIENMDNIQTQLENLENSKKASEKIMEVYDQYNKVVLAEKAIMFLKAFHEEEKAKQFNKTKGEEFVKSKENLAELQETKEHLIIEEADLRKRLDAFDQQDLKRLVEREKICENELLEEKQKLSEKEKVLTNKKELERKNSQEISQKEEEEQISLDEIREKCEEMGNIFSYYSFDEHGFMEEELLKQVNEPYQFNPLISQLKKISENLSQGLIILGENEKTVYFYEQTVVEQEKKEKEIEAFLLQKEQYETCLFEEKENWIERFYQWSRGNEECILQEVTERQIVQWIQDYAYGQEFETIRSQIGKEYEICKNNLKEEAWQIEKKRDEQKNQVETIRIEMEEWENRLDPEPEKSDEVIKNREWLEKQGISFEPLYRVLEFTEQMNPTQKNRLEESLFRMGLLDACVVPAHLREKVLAHREGMCDTYIFGNSEKVKENLSSFLEVSLEQTDIVFYQQLVNCLQGIGIEKSENDTCILADGTYRIGMLEGTITGTYEAKYIGVKSRQKYRLEKLEALRKQYEEAIKVFEELDSCLEELQKRIEKCNEEYGKIPSELNLKEAAKCIFEVEEKTKIERENLEKIHKKCQELEENIRRLQKEISEVCKTLYLKADKQIFEETRSECNEYEKAVYELKSIHQAYLHQHEMLLHYMEQKEQILSDLDDVLYDIGNLKKGITALEMELASIKEQLSLEDYQDMKNQIEKCTLRLQEIEKEKQNAILEIGKLENQLVTLQGEMDVAVEEILRLEKKRNLFEKGFEDEEKLGLVEMALEEVNTARAKKYKEYSMSISKNSNDLNSLLQGRFHGYIGEMADFGLVQKHYFPKEDYDEFREDEDPHFGRIVLLAKYKGREVSFLSLVKGISSDVEIQKNLVKESDRELFEDILANTISKKIRSKIYNAEDWIGNMNKLMEQMNTSSGLKLNLVWKKRRAEEENQLDTSRLVELLKKDAGLMSQEEIDALSEHFKSKVAEARRLQQEDKNLQSFHTIMKEVLDYRNWFEFQLFYEKTGERKKELTNNAFFTFSGGEKAMSMYVPLFSAVVAKYQGARKDAPRLVSLDEAFAGVDEHNIKDMFRLMVDFDFEFIINSQILWGDVETLPRLSIYQLLRPENAKYVSTIHYHWDGKMRSLVV